VTKVYNFYVVRQDTSKHNVPHHMNWSIINNM